MTEARQTTARFGDDIYQRLTLAAHRSGLPINSVVIVACMEWLEHHYPDIETAPAKPTIQLFRKIKGPLSRTQQRACSFCGKRQQDVQRLVAGPGVYICDECVDLCNQIIVEETSSEDDTPPASG